MDPFEQGDTFDPATVRWVWSLADVRHVLDGIERAAEIVEIGRASCRERV